MKTILVTGASGYLGSHVVEELVNGNFKVVALKRKSTNLWRCDCFADKVHWINCDNMGSAEIDIIRNDPDILI
jgi:nucleoside-diphosphate-sugar epimerase